MRCYLNLPRKGSAVSVASCLTSTLDGSVLVDIEVTPQSKRSGIKGINTWRSRLSVAVRAEARDGRANQAVLHVFCRLLGIDANRVSIVAGRRSTLKSVRIERMDAEALLQRLEHLLEGLP